MNEFKVPAVPWFYLNKLDGLHSSKTMTVWVLLDKSSTDVLVSHLDQSAVVEHLGKATDGSIEFTIVNVR